MPLLLKISFLVLKKGVIEITSFVQKRFPPSSKGGGTII